MIDYNRDYAARLLATWGNPYPLSGWETGEFGGRTAAETTSKRKTRLEKK
jgi:hypothetical protein